MWLQELTEYSEIDFQHQIWAQSSAQWPCLAVADADTRQGEKTNCCNLCKRQGKACKTGSVLAGLGAKAQSKLLQRDKG
jgi:hypothetical protein